MSKMSELYAEIELMLEQDVRPAKIAILLDCPVHYVYEVLESLEEEMNYTELFSPGETVNS